jgi:hypothetical protein
MKKRFTRILAALALLVGLTIPLGMWGQDYSTTYTSNVTLSTTNGSNASSVTIKVNSTDDGYSAIKLGASKNNGYAYISVPANTTTLHVHCAGWNNDGNGRTLNLTTEATGVTISPASMALTNDAGIAGSGSTFTLNTPDNASTSYYASFTLTGVNAATTIKLETSSKRAVYWGINAELDSAPTVAAPTISPASCSFETSIDVTVTPASGTTAYYTIDGSEPSSTHGTQITSGNSANLNFTATTTVRAIAYDGNDNASSLAEATYTKFTFNSIEDITEAGTYTVRGTVVAVATKGFVVGDGTGYVYVYLNSTPSVSLNDKVIVSGSVILYANGKVFEFTNNPAPTISTTETSGYVVEDPTPYTGAQIETFIESNHLSDYVEYVGTYTHTGYSIALEGTEVLGKISYPTSAEISQMESLDGKTVRVRGYFTGTNQNSEYFYTMLGTIEEVASTEPEIDATAGSEALAYNATTGNITYEITNYEGATMAEGVMEATTTVSWISGFTYNREDEVGEVNFTIAPNTGGPREATVTLTFTYGNNQITTDVTVSQHGIPAITVTPDAATVPVAGDTPEFTFTYESLVISGAGDFAVEYFESATSTTATTCDWIDYEITAGTTGYVLTLLVDANTDAQRVAYLKVFAYDGDDPVYSNLVTVTQSAPALSQIDLRGTTTAVSFNAYDCDQLTGSYGTYENVTYTGSNGIEYSGWNLTRALKSGQNLQLEKNTGVVEMPTIKSDYGVAITVNATTNNVTVSDGTNSGTDELSVYSTQANIIISAIGAYAKISTITITPLGAPQEYTLTVAALNEHINGIYVFDAEAPNTQLIADGLAGSAQVEEGTVIHISPDVEEGYVIQSLTVKDGNNNDVETTYHSEGEYYSFTMPASDVTISATARLVPVINGNYHIFTGDLVEGDYVIYYNGKAMNHTVSSDRLGYTEVTPENDLITINNGNKQIVWHIAPSDNYWTIYSVDADAYAAGTGVNNKAQMLGDGTDDKALWTVIGTETFEFVNKYNSENGKNANLRNNGTYGFACYGTNTGGALTLFKRVVTTESYTKSVDAYPAEGKAGYYLIASPVYGLNPASVEGMTEDEFDLYYFDQSGTDVVDDEEVAREWRNYEASSFYLTPSKGYLYAKSADVTLTFEGMPYEGDGHIALSYDGNATLKGWNLIGNPFGTAATLNMPFYKMAEGGAALTAKIENLSTTIGVMEGVFVEATTDGQTATFTAAGRGSEPQSIAYLNINVNKNRSEFVDNAIVRFDGGQQLGKFSFRQGSTKVYMTENGKDYAIVNSAAEADMPVSFKASENGTYTLNIEAENVNMNYLHLIDNMTGADVDLLATPSYSFEARTTDYANRFRLVFNANGTSDAEAFAYFNGSSWTISNVGEATLQVVDVTGRMVSSETINGNATISLNQTPGVYMLRLVNGDNVKTQKVVVR